jgi:DNA repair exonuclease SbcCD ATPase subunit
MSDEKDRLAELLRQRERAEEDHYFAEESRKQIEKLRAAHAAADATGKNDCPRCGAPLEVRQIKGVGVEACSKGCGMWLDRGELEEITKREGDSWLARLLVGGMGR